MGGSGLRSKPMANHHREPIAKTGGSLCSKCHSSESWNSRQKQLPPQAVSCYLPHNAKPSQTVRHVAKRRAPNENRTRSHSMIDKLPSIKLDLHGHINNLNRQGTPNRVFFFEHGIEEGIKESLCQRFNLCEKLDKSHKDFPLRREVKLNQFLGLEFMRVFPKGINWQGLPTSTTAAPPSIGPIQSWNDLEAYPWPTIQQVDFSDLEWFEKNLPDNITTWAMTYLFQQVSNLFGFEPLCMMLSENRDLVKAVIEKVGEFFIEYTKTLCQFSRLGAINIGDDMGHKTGTFISPTDLTELFLPWHKRIIGTAHAHGKLGLFHVCGKVDAIMDDLIDTVQIDARHSTQDVIETITQTKQTWGKRVALLGGIDVDFITCAKPQDVRPYTRRILETCVPNGGFSLGIGNWVADSIPIENYLTMIDEARNYNI